MFYETAKHGPRPAARSVQGHRRAAPDRLDHHHEPKGDDQPRALLVLQRRPLQAADGDVRVSEGAKDSLDFVEETERVRLQPRDLGSARPDEPAPRRRCPRGTNEMRAAGLERRALAPR